ncbi:hydrolase [Schizosaccharomyces japonicus yFS275]|uniref:Hydrolase n=1 Tax=Schizosaccharomyces japonicus (strain yFS275 / FY16936) TaxID=402676 RepID=B6JYX2_SCHJY|nr:hydrolase [Schizosaccharomyces japonicus yFS275]EEB06740.1 hydrolase [Schizosaccharomyces japonicus yFS275]
MASVSPTQSPVDERTSLLPRYLGIRADGTTRDDDKSPLFRWIRSVSFTLLAITLIVYILLVVNLFVSIPVLTPRSPGFLPLGFNLLSMGILLLQLLSSYEPSVAERFTQRVVAVLLAVDVVVMMVSGTYRHTEGWRGILWCSWALIVALWAIAADFLLMKNSGYYDEALSSERPRWWSWRLWSHWTAASLGSAIVSVVTILLSLSLLLRWYDSAVPVPGHLYSVADYSARIHMQCFGNQSSNYPTILLEGGEYSVHPLKAWLMQLQGPQNKDGSRNPSAVPLDDRYNLGDLSYVPEDTRVCVWDRPGMGWSDNVGTPVSAGMVTDILSEVLEQAHVPGPYVVVAHGVGGVYSTIFAARHVNDVKGLVLIDSGYENTLKDSGRMLHRFWVGVRGVFSPLGLGRMWYWLFTGKSRLDRIAGEATYINDRWIKNKMEESLTGPLFSLHELRAATSVLPKDLPVAVISSGKNIKRLKRWAADQRGLSKLTQHTMWDIASNAGHNVWLDAEGASLILKRIAELAS